jgi:5-methylcytosine-specific restriction endonuclease McrA
MKCEQCGVGEVTGKSTKFCSRSCSATAFWDKRLDSWLKGEHSYSTQWGTPPAVKRFLLKECDFKCTICSFSGTNPVTGKSVLTVDHIDGDATNNARSNLRVICPNCHSMTENYGALNKGNSTRKYRYTP